MDIEEFDFELPARLIAQKPMVPRDASRLLQVGAALEDHQFSDLPGLLAPGDILVFNDTRVIPARLDAMRGAAAIEITLTKELGATRWRALARPAKRLSEGDRLVFAQDFAATVAAKGEGGEITIDFEAPQGRVRAALEAHGRMPLPPYIKRPKAGAGKAQATDHSDYQTIYARRDGAIAAPTAGLHFTPQLIDALSARGILGASVTLHVGAGTFLPVTSARVEDHVMHGEAGMIQHASAAAINAARREGGRIIAVGTTSLRLIESAAAEDGTIRPFAGDTNLFITPGYRFKAVDGLITNFHLPRSTLYILVSAFAGSSRMRAAYEHAKAAGYRFYSYGDSSLLFPERPR